jgi:uncharacterized protein YbgA (DUF1722 family)/uncharacterized protein YbbK (DUF523 family)
MPNQDTEADIHSWNRWHAPELPLRLGVSACLLGEEVRYDTGHARDRFVTDTLSRWFEFVPVCPEVEIGMGIPRPTIRLVDEGKGQGVRLVAPSTGEDFTERMTSFAEQKVEKLMKLDLDGYILKRGSPSCGMDRVKTYRNGMPARKGDAGLFTEKMKELWPALPLEEEGRLNDPVLRENFIERTFCRNRWRGLVGGGLSRRRLIEFHTAHKLLLLAHNEAAYRRLGRLVGSAGEIEDKELFARYEIEFQAALQTKATVRRHVNVLQHAHGHLKTLLSPKEKSEVLLSIQDFADGLLPLIVPVTLMRYNIRRHDVTYLLGQLYFDPHPKELMLRNHA